MRAIIPFGRNNFLGLPAKLFLLFFCISVFFVGWTPADAAVQFKTYKGINFPWGLNDRGVSTYDDWLFADYDEAATAMALDSINGMGVKTVGLWLWFDGMLVKDSNWGTAVYQTKFNSVYKANWESFLRQVKARDMEVIVTMFPNTNVAKDPYSLEGDVLTAGRQSDKWKNYIQAIKDWVTMYKNGTEFGPSIAAWQGIKEVSDRANYKEGLHDFSVDFYQAVKSTGTQQPVGIDNSPFVNLPVTDPANLIWYTDAADYYNLHIYRDDGAIPDVSKLDKPFIIGEMGADAQCPGGGYAPDNCAGKDTHLANPDAEWNLNAVRVFYPQGYAKGARTAMAWSWTSNPTIARHDGNNIFGNAGEWIKKWSVGADAVSPVRSGGQPAGSLPSGTAQATLSLSTNESAICKYSTIPNTAYNSMAGTFSITGSTSHSGVLSNLVNGNAYNYYVKCKDASGNINTDDYQISFGVSTFQTLSVSLSVFPSSGVSPLNGVDLTADVAGTAQGTINYTFYCNRQDAGTNITAGWQAKYDNTNTDPRTSADICNYSAAGTYTAKVIAERGSALPAEARATITVTGSGAGSGGNGGGGSSGSGGGTSDQTVPPSNPSNFQALPSSSNIITLSWQNPSSSDFYQVRIQRNTTDYPASIGEGATIYEGSGTGKVDSGLTINQTYYYTIFTSNGIRYSSGAKAKAIAQIVSATPTPTPTSTPASQTGTTTSSSEEDALIKSLQAMIAQLLAQIATLQAEIAKIQGVSIAEIPTGYTFNKFLYIGQKNDNDVRYLQIFLKSRGTAIYPEGLVTGNFKLATYNAVIRFQLKEGIIGSASEIGAGYIGPKTRERMNEILGG